MHAKKPLDGKLLRLVRVLGRIYRIKSNINVLKLTVIRYA
jgi:hypothetical protein